MNKLFLTLFVFDCKRGKIFPEESSTWSKKELLKILSISGVDISQIDNHVSFNYIVNILLQRLNIQGPNVYSLDSGNNILFNSKSCVIRDNILYCSPYSEWSTFYNNLSCEKSKNEFTRYQRKNYNLFTSSQIKKSSPKVWKDNYKEIIRLKEKIKKLENDGNFKSLEKMRKRLEEYKHIVNYLQIDLRAKQHKGRDATIFKLMQKMESLKAEVLFYKNKVEYNRNNLSLNCNQHIQVIEECKYKLLHARNKLNKLEQNL